MTYVNVRIRELASMPSEIHQINPIPWYKWKNIFLKLITSVYQSLAGASCTRESSSVGLLLDPVESVPMWIPSPWLQFSIKSPHDDSPSPSSSPVTFMRLSNFQKKNFLFTIHRRAQSTPTLPSHTSWWVGQNHQKISLLILWKLFLLTTRPNWSCLQKRLQPTQHLLCDLNAFSFICQITKSIFLELKVAYRVMYPKLNYEAISWIENWKSWIKNYDYEDYEFKK